MDGVVEVKFVAEEGVEVRNGGQRIESNWILTSTVTWPRRALRSITSWTLTCQKWPTDQRKVIEVIISSDA
jgi:hypothetical protein